MTVVGVGTDLVDLDRFRAMLERRPGLLDRLFTAGEREYAHRRNDPTERLAVRFATKEAVLKAMGVGIGATDWHDIEVVRDDDGRPTVALHGRAARLAHELGIAHWQLTLSHSDLIAQAFVVASAPTTASGSASIAWDGVESPDRSSVVPPRSRFGWEAPDAGGLVDVVTPAEMAEIDRRAPEPVEVLIGRAGAAVARTAVRMMGGTYGRRVVVVVGKGNNGNDGRDAARRMSARGVRVTVLDASSFEGDTGSHADAGHDVLPDCDLVIDAAYGTGFRGTWPAPIVPAGALVLAVDIPSGVDGLTGACEGGAIAADATVTFAAPKPGLLQGVGRDLAGDLVIADIGLDTRSSDDGAITQLVGAAAVAGWLPERPFDAHKWHDAVWVVAGSPGMEGAAALCAGAAARTGAGYVRVSAPGVAVNDPALVPVHPSANRLPIETVRVDLPADEWAAEVVAGLGRFGALVIGNGLGIAERTIEQVRRTVAAASGRGVPTVVDADGLTALGRDAARFVGPTTVLTPHDGEFERLAGARPGPDRIAAARDLAAEIGAVVLLKGPTTIVAAPDGRVLASIAGDRRLATAGTGDVLAGVIGALLARGLDPLRAAAGGAFIHGRAGALGWPLGLVASDLVAHLPAVLDELTRLRP